MKFTNAGYPGLEILIAFSLKYSGKKAALNSSVGESTLYCQKIGKYSIVLYTSNSGLGFNQDILAEIKKTVKIIRKFIILILFITFKL